MYLCLLFKASGRLPKLYFGSTTDNRGAASSKIAQHLADKNSRLYLKISNTASWTKMLFVKGSRLV